jgi:hypothetical protein
VADGVFAFLVDAEVEAGLCDPLTVPVPCGWGSNIDSWNTQH